MPDVRNGFKIFAAILIIATAVTVGVVVALVTSISVSNNVTIIPGVGIGVQTFQTQPLSCPAVGSSSYGTVSAFSNTVAWSFAAGGSQTQWFCVENQGSGVDSHPSITLGTVTGITCSTSPCLTLLTNPSTLVPMQPQTVSAPLNVTLTANADTTPSSGTVQIIVS